MNTMCALSLANHLRTGQTCFVLPGLISATEQLRGELHKSEVFLIASTLLVVKAENIYRNTIKMHKTMEYLFIYLLIITFRRVQLLVHILIQID